jgi:hypothetical protein
MAFFCRETYSHFRLAAPWPDLGVTNPERTNYETRIKITIHKSRGRNRDGGIARHESQIANHE